MILFPASYIPNEELSYSLIGKHKDVLLVCTRDFREDYNYDGHYIVDDFSSTKLLISKIEEYIYKNDIKLQGIVGIDDEEQFLLTKALAEHFSLDFYTEEVLQIASNKYAMKKRFSACDVPSADYCMIETAEDNKISFPNVLKPICGSGSEFVLFNKDMASLKRNLLAFKASIDKDDKRFRELQWGQKWFDSRRQYLVEEFIDGQEYSCDFMVSGGRISLLRTVKKLPSSYFGLFGGYFLMNRDTMKSEGIEFEKLLEVCGKVATSLHIGEGVCMVDFKINRDGMFVVECSIRPGFGTFIVLMQRVYGYSSIGAMIDLKMQRKTRYGINRRQGLAVHIIAPMQGKIIRLDIDDFRGLDGHFFYNQPGDIVRFNQVDPTEMFLGYLIFDEVNDIQNIFKLVKRHLKLEIENEGA